MRFREYRQVENDQGQRAEHLHDGAILIEGRIQQDFEVAVEFFQVAAFQQHEYEVDFPDFESDSVLVLRSKHFDFLL